LLKKLNATFPAAMLQAFAPNGISKGPETNMRTKRNVVAYRTPPASRIAATVSDDFLRDIAGVNIDLSGCPSVTSIPDSNFLDERFSTLSTDGGNGALQFKRWMRESQKANDSEVKKILESKIRDGVLPRQADDAEADAKTYFINGEPVSVERKGQMWEAVLNGKRYIASTREGAAMTAARNAQPFSEPSAQAKLEIARYVSGVHSSTTSQQAEEIFIAAVKKYIYSSSAPNDDAALADIRYLPLVNDAIRYCWECVRSFTGGPDWPDFASRYLGANRPYTAAGLDAARNAYQAATQVADRIGVAQPAPEDAPTPEAIDDMSDQEIATLMREVSRQAARESRPRLIPTQEQ
jgi:hypothetical protein